MDMADTVPASEFTKNFGRYKMEAQHEAVPVSSHGQIIGFFVSPHEYQELPAQRHAAHLRDRGLVGPRIPSDCVGADGPAPRPSEQDS
jgi:hypothetical protein